MFQFVSSNVYIQRLINLVECYQMQLLVFIWFFEEINNTIFYDHDSS